MSLWKRLSNLWLLSGIEMRGRSLKEVVEQDILGRKEAKVIDLTPKPDLFENHDTTE